MASEMQQLEDKGTFGEEDLVAKEPYGVFQNWLDSARETACILDPNAMSLATATKDGKPSVRTVSLNGFSKDGFTFGTNYTSRKGRELTENPYASLSFLWCNKLSDTESKNRQVRIEGKVQQLTGDEAISYFKTWPRSFQIASWTSDQSIVIPGRHVYSEKKKEVEEKYASSDIPKPDQWGGYRLVPDVIEFWQIQTNWMIDRIRFRRPAPGETIDPEMTHQGDDGWVYERLAP